MTLDGVPSPRDLKGIHQEGAHLFLIFSVHFLHEWPKINQSASLKQETIVFRGRFEEGGRAGS
jgi:hypothetical protein